MKGWGGYESVRPFFIAGWKRSHVRSASLISVEGSPSARKQAILPSATVSVVTGAAPLVKKDCIATEVVLALCVLRWCIALISSENGRKRPKSDQSSRAPTRGEAAGIGADCRRA